MSGKDESEHRARDILVTFLQDAERPVQHEPTVVMITRSVLSGDLDLDSFVLLVLGLVGHRNHDDAIEAFEQIKAANDTSNADNSNRDNGNEAFEDTRQIDEDGSSISTKTGSFLNAASVLVENLLERIRPLDIPTGTDEEESQDQEEEEDNDDIRAHEHGQPVSSAENHQAQPQESQDATHSTLVGEQYSLEYSSTTRESSERPLEENPQQ
jgi:hypothetical protein